MPVTGVTGIAERNAAGCGSFRRKTGELKPPTEHYRGAAAESPAIPGGVSPILRPSTGRQRGSGPGHATTSGLLKCLKPRNQEQQRSAQRPGAALLLLFAAASAWLCMAPLAAARPATGQSAASATAPTLYSEEQANRGETVFAEACARCHGADLQGISGPPLSGPIFRQSAQFSKLTVSQLFEFVSRQMPYDTPGSLNRRQYLDVMAFILGKNGFPAGRSSLTEEKLATLKLMLFPAAAATATGGGKQ